MSAHMYRGQLDQKRKQRLEAERKAGDSRSKESAKRADAAKSRLAAGCGVQRFMTVFCDCSVSRRRRGFTSMCCGRCMTAIRTAVCS